MNKAAETVYPAICNAGMQKNVLPLMQHPGELYERIDFHEHERCLDGLFAARRVP